MPFQNTPPPFRTSSQRRSLAPRSSAAKTPRFLFETPQSSSSKKQFASTPRFVLSQPSIPGNSVDDDINGSDDEPPSSFSPAPRRRDRVSSLVNESETIDDVEEEETLPSARDESDVGALDTDNETGSDTGNYDIDAEFDILFPPTPSRRKRRRLSPPTPPPQVPRRPVEADQISSASDSPLPASPECISQPLSPELQSPRDYPDSTTYENPSTPKPSNFSSRQPYQSSNQPRFVFPFQTPFQPSQNIKDGAEPSNLSSTLHPHSTSRPQRNKPHFILPHVPSPDREAPFVDIPPISIPEAFSPSRHRSRRDGQTHGNGTDFVGGGMAVEARGWILGMVAKAHQQSQLRENNSLISTQEIPDGAGTAKYLLTSEAFDARCGNINAGGGGMTQLPISLVRLRHPYFEQDNLDSRPDTTTDVRPRSLLLLGPPGSVQTVSANQVGDQGSQIRGYSKIQKGNSVGVRKGFTWEIELGNGKSADHGKEDHGKTGHVANRKFDEEMDMEHPLRERKQHGVANGKWLVGVEWDVL